MAVENERVDFQDLSDLFTLCQNPVDRAKILAEASLSNQRRKLTKESMFDHCQAVVDILRNNIDGEIPENILAAAYLHDGIEKGGLSKDQLGDWFNQEIVDYICHLTEDETISDFRERKRAYLQQLSQSPEEVILISAADKIHNLWSSTRILKELRVTVGGPYDQWIFWGAFESGPHQTLEFYQQHFNLVKQRIGNNETYEKLVTLYEDSLSEWQSLITLSQRYAERKVNMAASIELRKRSLDFCRGINPYLKTVYNVEIVPASSVAHEAAVYEKDYEMFLHDVDFLVYGEDFTAVEHEELSELWRDEYILSETNQLLEQIKSLLKERGILPGSPFEIYFLGLPERKDTDTGKTLPPGISIASHTEHLLRNERIDELEAAKEIGGRILASLPAVYQMLAKLNIGQLIIPEEKKKLKSLVRAVSTYCSVFPNLLYRGIANIRPLIHYCDVIGANLEQNTLNEFWFKDVLASFLTVLNYEFKLPELNDNSKSIEELWRLSGAPKGMEGLRFLPGFRLLNWQQEPGDDVLTVVYELGDLRDYLRLRKANGREFFIASTSGAYGWEGIVRSIGEGVKVYGVVPTKRPILSNDPYLIFDRDGTLTSYAKPYTKPYEAFKKIRRILLETLTSMGIKYGLWSRNEASEVNWFAKKLSSSMVSFNPVVHFGNWPFFDTKTNPRYYLSLSSLDQVITSVSKEQIFQKIKEQPQLVKQELRKYAGECFGKRSLQAISKIIFQYIYQFCTRDPEDLLEAKVPLFVAITSDELNQEDRVSLIRNGVLVNDSEWSVPSVVLFGYNFIHVDNPKDIGKVLKILKNMLFFNQN